MKQRNWRAGYKNIIKTSLSDQTVKNYFALLAHESNISISHSYTSKSNTRYAAENSICGSIATLGVIATTHFITIDKEDEDIRAELKLLPEATRKLYDIVTDFFGTPAYPVQPWLLYSTDDTTEYIYDGSKKAYVHYVLTTGTSISK